MKRSSRPVSQFLILIGTLECGYIQLLVGKYLNVFRESEKKLSNPNRIRIRYSENPRDYIEPIDLAFKFASRELLKELRYVHDLMGRLNALRCYFLMNQGDFFLYFMSVARTELFGKADDVQFQRLQSLLELSVTNSNARHDKYADFLKVRLEKFDVVDMLALVLRIDKQIPDKKMPPEGFDPAPKPGEVSIYSKLSLIRTPRDGALSEFVLSEYGRSVTIVTNPERGFLNHQITHFHRQVPGF